MNQKVHNQIVSFIWSIADDVLRDVFVRGKYRDIILPFTVLRRLDALLVPSKEKVLEANAFLIKQNIDDKKALENQSGYPFWNISNFTFETLMNDADNIDSNLESYLDGYSPNVQEIISKFSLRDQLKKLKESELTYALIEKFSNKEINLSPIESKNSKGEILSPLTNLGMGYVFEELIRKFNEENNEEAGEHFTPREIIKLMTQILFTPVKDKIKKGTYLIYDPACGSGGMLTEAEHFAMEVTNNKADFMLYGQESQPETFAICTSDMLIKGEKSENISFGSTLSKDGFPQLHFDFMLSNPPYGKTWKIDEDAIVDDRGKKGKEKIKDPRFQISLPSIDDGQLLFLMNMVSKMKHNTELGSRIASVHSGSALFTGDAGGGASEIRKYLIENDWLDCIIALPTNIFYNTGIPTYILILNNKKPESRKGKIQLINALDLFEKLRKNLGQKNCEMNSEHLSKITNHYLEETENEISKIYKNDHFGYFKITIERPLRLSVQFTPEAISTLRFEKSIAKEMEWVYTHFGDDLYKEIKKYKDKIEAHLSKNEVKLKPAEKTKLLSAEHWKSQLELMQAAQKIADKLGNKQFDDYNTFLPLLNKTIKELKLNIDGKGLKSITDAITWKNEKAEPVIKKTENNGTKSYEPDSELRDTENVPLNQDIQDFFRREVLKYIPDAWLDESKTEKGYEIAFTRYFHKYESPILDDIKLKFKPFAEYENANSDYFKKIPKGWSLLPNIAIFKERIERNRIDSELLSVTITSGVIKQSEVDKNDTSNSDKSKYKFVNPNDLVYNKMRMWQGAVGISNYTGIASPAYVVIAPKLEIDSKFFHYQLRCSYYVNYSKRFSYGLCDDQLSLRYTDFKRMYSILPPLKTQNKIAEILTIIDTYLANKLLVIQRILGRKVVLQSNYIENNFYDYLLWKFISGEVDTETIEIKDIEKIVDDLFLASK
jgi:type I restriction enzyme M protein